MISQLPSLANHPVLAELFPPSTIGLLLQVWEHRHEVYQLLDDFRSRSVIKTFFPATRSYASPTARSKRLRLRAGTCSRASRIEFEAANRSAWRSAPGSRVAP